MCATMQSNLQEGMCYHAVSLTGPSSVLLRHVGQMTPRHVKSCHHVLLRLPVYLCLHDLCVYIYSMYLCMYVYIYILYIYHIYISYIYIMVPPPPRSTNLRLRYDGGLPHTEKYTNKHTYTYTWLYLLSYPIYFANDRKGPEPGSKN